LADQGKTGAWEAQALFSTGWNESTPLILSESFRSGGILRILEEIEIGKSPLLDETMGKRSARNRQ
jgi:hypothetical protein